MNALALVNGIVRLSKGKTADEFASVVAGRVAAIARAHRILADSHWRGSDLRELIDAEKPEGLADKFTVDGPSLILPAALVQPLALIIHELVTNALKHGALASARGTVTVTWREPREQLLRVQWRESGTARDDEMLRPGFGLQMVQGLVEKQLGGTTSMTIAGDGLNASLSVPLSR